MLYLFIETSNLEFQLALYRTSATDGAFLWRSDEAEPGPKAELHVILQKALDDVGHGITDVDEIIVDVGPGGLTSTRSGVAFANGLAFSTGAKIVQVTSTKLMMLQSKIGDGKKIVAARRSNEGKYFLEFFEDAKSIKLALGKIDELSRQVGWHDEPLFWLGPYPKAWSQQEKPATMSLVDESGPGLDAFALLLQRDDFSAMTRVEAAVPANEVLR